ncbi:MAG: DUF3311 domain-containing protein [Segniliparus sp.]|uniref:DUF3311 domain-containing protein n=1 Tax=Segniliparus sp. TaxID=2804064 RepID=UPI003F2B88D3
MSDPDPPRATARVPGSLRSAAPWRKLVIATAVALPILGFLVAIPFANRQAPIVLGLPFLQFWTTSCLAMTGVCLNVIFHLDPRNRITPAPGEPRWGRLPLAGEDDEQC